MSHEQWTPTAYEYPPPKVVCNGNTEKTERAGSRVTQKGTSKPTPNRGNSYKKRQRT